MPELVAIAMAGGQGFVDALRRVWDAGHAAFVVDDRLPRPAAEALVDAMAPEWLIDESGSPHRRRGSRPVADGDALVVATSGSTGEPKGVVHTHAGVAASAAATSARCPWTRLVTGGWRACRWPTSAGCRSCAALSSRARRSRCIHDSTQRRLTRSDATLVSLVATALARVEATRFRMIVLGGAAPPPYVPPNAVTTYGMTETGSGVVYDGYPLDGVEVRVDEGGEVWLRGPMLLRAYRNGVDPKTADGWLGTGDLGELALDGRLVVHGRRGDVIVSGGEKIWPEAVERCLSTHIDVLDVAVSGVDDAEWGQRAVAYVVPAERSQLPSLDALRDHVKAALPAYMAPRELVLVEAIPRTALGKVRRADLGSTT